MSVATCGYLPVVAALILFPAAGAADEPVPVPGTMPYVELDTLVVVYPHYQRDYDGGHVQMDLSAADIETLKTEAAEAWHSLWRSSNCKCLVKADWMTVDRVLTPAQLWEAGKGRYLLPYPAVGNDLVERDLRAAGVGNGQYAAVVAFYAFQNSEGAVAAVGGLSVGVDRHFLGNTALIVIPLHAGLDRDGILVHEYLHALDSMFTASGNPAGDMGHADRPPEFPYPADSPRHFWFLLANVLDPQSWLALDPEWARVATAPDADGDGIPDAGDLPLTEESFGSAPAQADTDDDGLSDLGELTAAYYRASDPLNPDTDGDGLPDGADAYPLFWCHDQVAKSTPQIDGLIRPGEYTQVSWPATPANSDLQVSAYAGWSDDVLYVAADVVDDTVQTPYQDPYRHFNDNFEICIDALQDGWTTGDQRNYRFYAVPVGTRGKPYIFGEFGSLVPGDTAYRAIDVSCIMARYARRGDGYSIEMAIPTNVLSAAGATTPDVCLQAGASARVTFAIRDHDAYADWPKFNLFTAADSDTPAFITLHFTPEPVSDP